jgi:hypothetical protein
MGRSKPFLRETPIDKAFRYRGVIAVVSVPVLLIVLVAGLMPRAAVDLHDPHPEAGYERRIAHLPHSSQPPPFRATAPGRAVTAPARLGEQYGVRIGCAYTSVDSRSQRASKPQLPCNARRWPDGSASGFASGLTLRAISSPVDSQR